MYSTRASKPKDTNHTSTHLAQDNHDILTQDIEILQYEISISMKFVHLELVLLIGVTLAMPNTCSSKSGGPQDNPIATLRIWQWYIPLKVAEDPATKARQMSLATMKLTTTRGGVVTGVWAWSQKFRRFPFSVFCMHFRYFSVFI